MTDTTTAAITVADELADDDSVIGVDKSDTTESSQGSTRRFTWSRIKSTLQTAFDSRYAPFGDGAMRRLMMMLKHDVSNASVVVIGDSTGNETNEWVYLLATWLGTEHPSYTVTYRVWDDTDYASAVTIQTGTGSNTLTVWNASVPGALNQHFLGSRFANAFVGKEADLVMVSSGHNDGGPLDTANAIQAARNWNLALIEEVLQVNPYASAAFIAQNPSFISGREQWQRQRSQVLESLCRDRGYGFVNVGQVFYDYGTDAEILADLYDGGETHTSTAGSALWTEVVAASMVRARNTANPAQAAAPLTLAPAQQLVASPLFEAWSGTDPDGWSVVNCTTSKETTNKETGTQAMRLTATGTGQAYAQCFPQLGDSDLTAAGALAGKTWTVAARISVPASNTATVRLQVQDNNGSSQNVSTAVQSTSRDRFQWVFATKTFPSNATAIHVLVYVRAENASTAATCDVDRVFMVPGTLPHVA